MLKQFVIFILLVYAQKSTVCLLQDVHESQLNNACEMLTAALYCQNTLFLSLKSHFLGDKASSKDKISTGVLAVNN